MKVKEFFVHTTGNRYLRFDGSERPLCGRDFWGKYRRDERWNAEIDHVELIAQTKSPSDGIECIITLKGNSYDGSNNE